VWGGRCGYRRGVHLGRRAGLHGGRNCGSVCWRCLRSRGRRNCSALGNSGSAMIHTNQIRVNIADLAVLGLDAGEDKAVDQDGEALSARYGAEGVWSLRALLKTCALSGWLAQSTYPKSSAQAVEARRKQPASRIDNRMRAIIPSSARGHAEP